MLKGQKTSHKRNFVQRVNVHGYRNLRYQPKFMGRKSHKFSFTKSERSKPHFVDIKINTTPHTVTKASPLFSNLYTMNLKEEIEKYKEKIKDSNMEDKTQSFKNKQNVYSHYDHIDKEKEK